MVEIHEGTLSATITGLLDNGSRLCQHSVLTRLLKTHVKEILLPTSSYRISLDALLVFRHNQKLLQF
jgi:hypothetical protein